MPFKNPHPLYSVWRSMLRRCYDPNFKQFSDYGGRGIDVCERWRDSFRKFLEDMGERPPGHTLERVRNDAGYSPGNCRWATRSEQQRNQRVTRRVTIEGCEYVAAALAEQAGLKTDTIVERARLGLPFNEVVSPKRRADGNWRKAVATITAKNRAASHCKHGHEFTPENTRVTPQGWRNCRACAAAKTRRLNAARRARGLT